MNELSLRSTRGETLARLVVSMRRLACFVRREAQETNQGRGAAGMPETAASGISYRAITDWRISKPMRSVDES